MKYCATVLSALWASTAGANLAANNKDYQTVIDNAADGDTIELAPGDYVVTDPIVVDKNLAVVGGGANFIVGSAADAVFAFGNMPGYATTLDKITVSTVGGASCSLGEPYALQANFSIEILEAYVRNNNVNLRTDVGVWHNERKLNDFYFEDCHYAVDHPEKMSGGVYKLMGNCRSELDFSVSFDKLGGTAPTGCGTTIKDYGTFTSYEAQIEAQWDEYVKRINDEEFLRIPVVREGNAVTNLLVQIDTVANVAATINSKWNNTLGCDPTRDADCPQNCYPGSQAVGCQPTGCDSATTPDCPETCHMYSTDPACYPDGCDPATDDLCPPTCNLYSTDPACYPGGCDPDTNPSCPVTCELGSTEPECNTGGCDPDVDENCPVNCRPGSVDPACQPNGCTTATNQYCPSECHMYSTEPECHNPGGCNPAVITDCPATCSEGSTLPECNPGGCDPNSPDAYNCPPECNLYSTAPECIPFVSAPTGSITVKAIHASSGTPLSGVEAVVLSPSGEIIETKSTGEDGVVTFTDIPEGKYTVKIVPEVTDETYGDIRLVGDPEGEDVIDGETTVVVVKGQSSDAGVFPYDNEGTISGQLTAGDYNSPLVSETVTLTDENGILISITFTDNEGRYAFTGLNTNNQQYTVIAPTNSLFTDVLDDEPFNGDEVLDGSFVVTITPTETSVANVDYHYSQPLEPYVPMSNITGTAYTTTTDEPIPGVVVKLIDPETNEVIEETTTGPDGTYTFEGVPPGKEYIIEVPPENPKDLTQQLTDDYLDPTNSGTRTPIYVTPATELENVNFGYTPPGTITGHVRNTKNEMIEGVTVTLTNGDDVRTTLTNQEGIYFFDEVYDSAIYTVTMTKPDEYLLHDDEYDVDGAKVLDGISPVDYKGVSISDVNFVLTQEGIITGSVMMLDGTPIPNVPVILISEVGYPGIRFVFTDENGEYTFDNIEVGDHYVDVPRYLQGGIFLAEDPDGFRDGNTKAAYETPNTALTVPPFKYDVIPVTHLGSIEGSTRIANTLEPIQDVLVYLRDAQGNVLATTKTEEDGTFIFFDLSPKYYTVIAPMEVASRIGDATLTDDHDHNGDGIVASILVNNNPIKLDPYLYMLREEPTACDPAVDADCPEQCSPYSTAAACNPPGCTAGVDADCPVTCSPYSADPACNPGCDTVNDPYCPVECSPYSTSAACNPPGCDPTLNDGCPVTCSPYSTDPACNPGGCDPSSGDPNCPQGCHAYSTAPACNVGGCDPAADADCPVECTPYSTDPACSHNGCDPDMDEGCPSECNLYSTDPQCGPQPPVFDIEAAINLVDVGFFDGWNHSKIRLETHLPSPMTIQGGLVGVVGMRDVSFEAEVSSISSYVFDAACNNVASGKECVQNVEFDIVTCDLTGEYSLEGLIVTCQEQDANGDPQACPALTDAQIFQPKVIFFIDTNNFCEVEEFELDALFDLSIAVYASDEYLEEESIFDLGTMSYWQIIVDTSESGVALYNAEVTYVERTTDGDCSGFADYMGDVTDNAEFSQTYKPATQAISMPFQVTSQMACATSDRTGNAITMNFTVLVDYDDGSAGRRRRSLNGLTTRDAGEVAVDKEAGVRYTAEDLIQAAVVGAGTAAGTTAAAQADDSELMIIGGAVAALLLLCLCCCCCVVACIVVMRRRAAEKKYRQEDNLVSQQSQMGFMSGASNMSFANQPGQQSI
ncbi:hypothetical protein SARC_00987 [Sphaeroforma arctica JP610]|uniref:SpaA-like prealbumin fold domain-containing protein n=1 Tax=Sphaeroforma arctica JP610 TaxID=667725 RepID=A0A0L0GCZ6_9EUKA|nr:hypothetical protein SARC_00987 [Sphaeroforma arctica JP610]KNC86892.1 hypothetical protein SARC_00987 [Sphaeroforma arctica JP610]|eukprot:XP_014160794.1 hypothetical protein SARC_00987 [Sphaeroforma arctica JP610]